MCGIAGFWRGKGEFDGEQVLESMITCLKHRGPDDAGRWLDEDTGVGLGHRRLSIIDVSPLGHQPMESASGRYIVVFNGELYNFVPVRDELRSLGHSFRGGSDTEVLLAAIEEWGVLSAVRRLHGMLSMALWDREERRLTLARDRLGEKPLYYTTNGGRLAFGSELKAIRRCPGPALEIDRGALALYFRHHYIPAPHTIFSGVRKVMPGTIVSVTYDGTFRVREETYWNIAEIARRGARNPFTGSLEDATDELNELLRSVVRDEMVSDVPLGAFLSGGIDSSTVVAVMQEVAAQPVRTFTIGFTEREYDESPPAEAVARHLVTSHTALMVTPRDAQAAIPLLPAIYDEPFADSSQVPTFLVSRLASEHVTVSLSGDGGDELFAGYSRYPQSSGVWQRLQGTPAALRNVAGSAMSAVPHSLLAALGRLTGGSGSEGFEARWMRRARLNRARNDLEVFRELVSMWGDPSGITGPVQEPEYAFTNPPDAASELDPITRLCLMDALTYLPDDIMVKVDRAAMAVSLETRAPFLHPSIAEFAFRLPLEHKYRNGRGKLVLREVLDRYVPRELIERPKKGFSVPITHWLRSELRDWADDCLDPETMRRQGLLDTRATVDIWHRHRSGRENRFTELWPILMFQSWLAHWDGDGERAAATELQASNLLP